MKSFDPMCMRLLTLWLLIFTEVIQHLSALPAGFVDEGVTRYPSIMSAVFAPNPKPGTEGKPMLLLAKKEGSIAVMEDPEYSQDYRTVLQMGNALCSNSERGVQTIQAHPDFLANPYIYVYYTSFANGCTTNSETAPSNRLSRFTMDTNSLNISMSSEVILFETPPHSTLIHNGGGLIIGNDMNIYLSTGDSSSVQNSNNLRSCWGKLIRLRLDGTVPQDNPYTASGTGKGVPCRFNRGVPLQTAPADAVCEEIYAYGLRSPFRINVDTRFTNETRFSICDVGGRTWEDISLGGTQFKGSNYGWPVMEGPCVRNSLSDCPVPAASVDPYHFYQNIIDTGTAPVGAVFVPENLWPDQYKLLSLDNKRVGIYNLVEGNAAGCRTCVPPVSDFRMDVFHAYIDLVQGFFAPYKSTQAFYYLSRRNDGVNNVRRIFYVGGNNNAPTAVISELNPAYVVNETINFLGNQSSDIDGDALTYYWIFGDGRTSDEMNPSISYPVKGSYTVTLIVTDPSSQSDRASTVVEIGVKPNAVMESPALGMGFMVGEVLLLKGSAYDFGLNQPIVDPTKYSWEVRQHHANHYHPFLDEREGNDFNLFPAPRPEDFLAATNSYLEVIMTVHDSDGLSTRISRNVYPKNVTISIDSVPSGLEVVVDSNNVFVTPVTIVSWQNHQFPLSTSNQSNHVLSFWSIGNMPEVTYIVPSSNEPNSIVAYFDQTSQPTIAPTIAPTRAPTSAPTMINCTVVATFDVYDAYSGLKVVTLANGTNVTNPPPCNYSSVKINPCLPYKVNVRTELFNAFGVLLSSRNDTTPPYYLYPHNLTSFSGGRMPFGRYQIRAIVDGMVSDLIQFRMGSCSNVLPSKAPLSAPIPIPFPTSLPTSSPTKIPTKFPTNVPTTNPTELPTNSPTGVPTKGPTITPTDNPTKVPTTNPTGSPTNNPTKVPTFVPTNNPSKAPTTNPTGVPTTNPTGSPTNNPTKVPTFVPTNNPSKAPTTNPTRVPTTNPTGSPTNNPTKVPTFLPTNNPSKAPTTNPTKIPTSNPTAIPTNNPTNVPTTAPMTMPTKIPTKVPTTVPIAAPTASLPPTITSSNCTIATFDLYNSISDTKVVTLVNGTNVAVPPPCNNTNIKVIPCDPYTGHVIIELYDVLNKRVGSRNDTLPPYFLYPHTTTQIFGGRMPRGTYHIRASVSGIFSPLVTFRMGACSNVT